MLVDSKPANAVEISPADLPVALAPMLMAHPPRRDTVLYNRLAKVLGMSTKRKKCAIDGYGVQRLSPIGCAVAQGYAQLSYQDVTIKTDVSKDVQYYLAERQQQFPGVSVQQVWLRRYPLGTLAAQLFGTVGRITPQEVHDSRYRGVSQNAVVGQSGLEWYYDRYLRGQDGAERVQVDALGHFTGDLSARKPVQGHSLKLSLDVSLQRAGQLAVQNAINANPPAQAGAFVAMDPDNGEVYAMGSLPTFNPNIFANPAGVPASTYKQLNNASSNFPLINRAIMSAYPTGSTFKPITATAALESGDWTVGDIYDDTGLYSNGPGDLRHNAGHASYGVLDLTEAIKVSSDDFFYNLGRLTNVDPVRIPTAVRCSTGRTCTGSARRPESTSAARRPATCPRRNGARASTARSCAASTSATCRAAGSPTAARGRSATTRTSPSARATSGSRRCSSRSRTRRSPTAGRSCARTSAWRSTRPTGPCCRRFSRRRPATSASRPSIWTRSGPACVRRPRSRAEPRPT